MNHGAYFFSKVTSLLWENSFYDTLIEIQALGRRETGELKIKNPGRCAGEK